MLEFLSGGEGADSSALDAAQAAQQRAFVRGLLPGIGHQGPVPSQAPPPSPPPQPDGDPAGVLVRPCVTLSCLRWLRGLLARETVGLGAWVACCFHGWGCCPPREARGLQPLMSSMSVRRPACMSTECSWWAGNSRSLMTWPSSCSHGRLAKDGKHLTTGKGDPTAFWLARHLHPAELECAQGSRLHPPFRLKRMCLGSKGWSLHPAALLSRQLIQIRQPQQNCTAMAMWQRSLSTVTEGPGSPVKTSSTGARGTSSINAAEGSTKSTESTKRLGGGMNKPRLREGSGGQAICQSCRCVGRRP